MSYIPKKLVNPGLYATGDNFLDATTRDVYRGPYHANFNGSLFSGNDPYDPEKRPLVPNPDKTVKPTRVINNPVNRNYEEINDKNVLIIPRDSGFQNKKKLVAAIQDIR